MFPPALIEQVRQGDRRAERKLYGRLTPILRSFFASRLGADHAAVDDLVQHTLLRLHEGLPRLKHPERFQGFVMRMALFELHDYYRGRHSLKEQLQEAGLLEQQADTGGHTEGAHLDLDRILEQLDEDLREILWLRAYGYSFKEIARMTGRTEGAVKMRLKRGLDRLRSGLMPLLLAVTMGLFMASSG